MHKINDIVETKKQHVCGSKLWKVLRVGADIKLECLGCQRKIIMPYYALEKRLNRNNFDI